MKKWMLLAWMMVLSSGAWAQCAMCKAAAQTDLEGGGGVADGFSAIEPPKLEDMAGEEDIPF